MDVFRHVKQLRTKHHANWLKPESLASVAAGDASKTQIYQWLNADLYADSADERDEHRGRPRALTEDREALLVGFAVSVRSSLKPVSLEILRQFCISYLDVTPSYPTLSRIMSEYGFSSQKTMSRNSRMVTESVVDDALSAIEEIRSFKFPPHRCLFMDETGLWSNVVSPLTYHFRDWYLNFIFVFAPLARHIHHFRVFNTFLFPSSRTCTLTHKVYVVYLMIRNNAVVKENGDRFRDTVALTIRGDGVDIPPYLIVHTYKNASKASGRRCSPGDEPVKGMTIPRMKDYILHISQYVEETSLLVMDRLSSHTSAKVRRYIESFTLPSGERTFIPILLPPKTAFLISPLDMGAISAFKSHYHKLDRGTLDLKLRSVSQAWDTVSNESLRNICYNCGVVGKVTFRTLRKRFMKEVVGTVPEKLEDYHNFYDAWAAGYVVVEGASRGRGVELQHPQQLSEAFLDGVYWNNFGYIPTPSQM